MLGRRESLGGRRRPQRLPNFIASSAMPKLQNKLTNLSLTTVSAGDVYGKLDVLISRQGRKAVPSVSVSAMEVFVPAKKTKAIPALAYVG